MPERDNKTQNEAASTEEALAAEEDAERAAAAELEADGGNPGDIHGRFRD